MRNRSRLVSPSRRLFILTCILILTALPATAPCQPSNQGTPSPAVPLRLGPDSDFAGNLFLAARDIEIACSLEMRPYLDRSYNSRSARTGYFGKGWTADPIDIRVEKRPDGKLIVVMGDGREEQYASGDGKDYRTVRPGESDGLVLAPTAEGGYQLRLGNGERWEFNPKGYLVTRRDLAGNLLTVRRDQNGISPLSIEGSFGKKLTVQWKNGRIAAIEGPVGLRVDYQYDARGRLVKKSSRALQDQSYTYDTAGLLARVKIAGGPDTMFTHQGGLLSGMRRGDGTALSYRYLAMAGGTAGDYRQEVHNESGQFLEAKEIRAAGNERVLIDGMQNRATMKFDRDGRLIALQGPEGKEEHWRYSAEGILEAYDDALGNRTTYRHSPDGLNLTITDPRGAGNLLIYNLSGFLESHVDPWGVVTKVRRDQLGRVTEVLRDGATLERYRYDRLGFVDKIEGHTGSLAIERDALGRITRMTDAERRSLARQSDIPGRPILQQDGEGRTTRWSHDPHGRLSAITDGAGNRLQLALSGDGLLRSFTDANGNAYRYDYRRGLPYALTFPNGTSEYTQLDALGRIVRETNHRGQAVEYAYDKLGRVARQSYHGGFTEWQYDASGQMTKASSAHSAYEIRYDRFGETAEIRDTRGRSTRYEYNDKGQRTALIDPEGKRTLYEYDRRGSLSKITGPGGESYRYEYDPAGRLMKRGYPNGISCLFGYDRAGALSSIHYRNKEGKTIHFISVGRDKSGRIVSHRENESIRYYGYDAAGRLIRVKKPDGSEEIYSYDRMGNRITQGPASAQKRLTYGRMNELLSDGPVTYRYDADGQPVARSDGFAYEFDPLGRLTGVRAPGKTIRYEYDPFGRLAAREVNGRKTEYLYDKEDIIAEYAGTALQARYVHGPGIDEPLSFTREGKLYVQLLGLNDTVRRVYGTDGRLVEEYELSPFGEIERPSGAPLSRQLFNGRTWDPDSRLYHVRARFYDPATGRFINPDPIRFRGGWNLYAYGGNDPVNRVDPFGLRPFRYLPDAQGITFSVWGQPTQFHPYLKYLPISFKVSASKMYFGENDPRNGWYLSGGPGLGLGQSAGISYTYLRTQSEDPYKSYEGPSTSMDISTGIPLGPPGGGSAAVSVKGLPWDFEEQPWVTLPDINVIQPRSLDEWIEWLMNSKTYPQVPFLTHRWKDLSIGFHWTATYQITSPNPRNEVLATKVSPPSARLKVGQSQKFTFVIILKDPVQPMLRAAEQTHDVTDSTKWYAAEDTDEIHSTVTENPFLCRKKGTFLIRARYINDYVFNPSDPLQRGAVGNATVECVEGDPGPPAGPDVISFTRKTYEVREDAGFADIAVRRQGSAKGRVIAQIHVRDGTATAGRDPGEGDYNRPGVDHVRWEAKDLADKSIHIPVNRDDLAEGTEDVNLELEIGLGNAAVDPQMGKAVLLIKDVLLSGIGLAKTASASQVTDGDMVTFTLEVTNTGKSRLVNVTPADTDCRGTPKPVRGDRNRDGILDPNEKWVYECNITLNGTGLYRNRATVEARDEAGEKVNAQAQAEVQVGARANIVPNVIGLTEENAVQAIRDAGLTPQKEGSKASGFGVGLVCEQAPEAGQSVSAGTKVGFWITANVPKYLYLDPPRKTLQLKEQVSFAVTMIHQDGSQSTPRPGELTWDPGPGNAFRCETPGQFTVWAKYVLADVYGSATVICEEDWSVPAYQPPVTHSTSRGPFPQAGPEEYKWYAFCDPAKGEVTYGERQLTGRTVMAGPFPGPRTAYDWIVNHCPLWRCDASGACTTDPMPGQGGEWMVLCGRKDLAVYLGKTYDATKHFLIRYGFLGEPDARAWVNKYYPGWVCTKEGGPVAGPRMGGNWAVVCSKKHGAVSLTQVPNRLDYYVWGEGFYSLTDARLWTNRNCPSWRCDAMGRCLTGVARRSPEQRPLELPPELRTPPVSSQAPAGIPPAGRSVGTPSPAPTPKPSPPSQAKPAAKGVDCKALRDEYFKKCSAMRDPFVDRVCTPVYSGCAQDPVGCYGYVVSGALPDGRSQARVSCGRGVLDSYISCLRNCNEQLVAGKLNTYTVGGCGTSCKDKAVAATKACDASHK